MTQATEKKSKNSWLKRLPMPLLAAVFGLVVGVVSWVLIDRWQTSEVAKILADELDYRLAQQAREGRLRFEHLLSSYAGTARLLAFHRRMAEHVEQLAWAEDNLDKPFVYRSRPPWLPSGDLWLHSVQPSHILLCDLDARVREVYPLGLDDLPQDLGKLPRYCSDGTERANYLDELDGGLFLVVSHPVTDISCIQGGHLVLLVPIEAATLRAAQQGAHAEDTVFALTESDTGRLIVSSHPSRVPVGGHMRDFETDYVVTSRRFQRFARSDLSIMFTTLVSREHSEHTAEVLLYAERQQRLIGAGLLIGAYVLLFVLVSARIGFVLRKAGQMARQTLQVDQPAPPLGNQLLIMEDWMNELITMAQRANEALRDRHARQIEESEALKRAVMDTSLDAIVTIAEDGRVVEFNPTAEQQFGIEREQALGKNLSELLIDRDSRPLFGDLLLRCSTSGHRCDVMTTELAARRPRGTPTPVELSIKHLEVSGESYYTVYLRDISTRVKQAEEIARLAAFPSESPIPMLRINRPGVIIYANDASDPLLSYWGCQRQQTLPMYWRNLVGQVLESGNPIEREVVTEERFYSLLLAPVADLGYVNLYARDITETRRAEEEARRRHDELVHVSRVSTMGEVATGIAHELNQPLSAITNYANGCVRRLRFGVHDEDALQEALLQISLQANRAAEIIKRLRGMVAQQPGSKEDRDLNEVITEVCSLVEYESRKLEVAIECRLSKDPLPVRIDSIRIEQAMVNLIRNGFDALQERPVGKRRIVIDSGRDSTSGELWVTIRDNGPGMTAEIKERLFEQFFTTKSTGMGMGMAITQSIVAEHKGRIVVWSESEQGASFTLHLPVPEERGVNP